MDEETRKMVRILGHLSTIGMAMAISVILGVLIGFYLDDKFNTEPWFFIIFLGLGIVAAFKNLHKLYKKAKDL